MKENQIKNFEKIKELIVEYTDADEYRKDGLYTLLKGPAKYEEDNRSQIQLDIDGEKTKVSIEIKTEIKNPEDAAKLVNAIKEALSKYANQKLVKKQN